jgi:glycosyltransferase involved in cell wall biosynthesis
MRIAFVTLGYTPLRDSGLAIGGERVVRTLLDAGHQVTVIAAARDRLPETHVHPALEIHRLPLGRSNWIGYAVRAAWKVQALNRVRPFDVVHFSEVHFAYPYRGPFVANLHHSFRQRLDILGHAARRQPQHMIYYELARMLAEKPAVRRAAGLLAVSVAARDEFAQCYGLSTSRIALARYGTDTEFFRPVPTVSLLQRLGLSESEPTVLFAGFVTPRKGLDYLAHALPLMRPVPRLILVGRWAEGYRARFLRLLGSLADRVIEAGYVPDEDMPAYYSLADVYVSASLMEGFGLPLAEALACETPVVAVAAGAVAEVIGPGGLLVPPRDPAALAEAVSELLRDAALRRELGQRGRAYIERDFSVQAMREATLDAYDRFLGRSDNSAASRNA